ncbi:PREDICTED: adenomatous polyposis coli protein-like [Papilio xuthus]|uniref:Adenomatous polyposis coli protein-like n=1 Tax=Papilio xuthus TaxID=66420 RepID=A0AAJ6Z722_PAPXU|nr:PREDICTED: adenomatous polyposis coli protein-like [Papilio xuthus]
MSARDFYKVMYRNKSSDRHNTRDYLDNDTEFNANHFKLYDDFSTDLRINFNSISSVFHEVTRCRRGDPNDSGIDVENGNHNISHDRDLLENEVMVDPWSSMDSSNSPLTDSGPSASEDCTPSTSSETPRGPSHSSSPLSPDARRLPDTNDAKARNITKYPSKGTDKTRARDLTLELETLESDTLARRPHFLDDDYQPPSRSNIECRIPKPHFLDHSPSPDEFDERSDITNPNFLDDEIDGDDGQAQKKSGALPKRPMKSQSSTYTAEEDRPHRTNYRTTLHYGLESAARSSERDKRASQLYRGTWPGERDVWTGQDSSSVRSFSSNGSNNCSRPSSNLENKMECVCSLISLLSLSPENNADLSGPLLEMSRSVESCIAMRQAGCIPLLVQLIHSKVPRETRDRAAKALRNIIHTQTDDKAGRREARVWRLLEQVREYCYVLEDLVDARKEGKEVIEDDATKHPSQSVAALMKLSFDEEHRHVVCQLGGLQALAALVSGDQAAHGSRTDDNTCLTMRKYAGMTLTNLTFGDGNNKSLLCSFKDFMLALVEQLESPNDDMRQVTAAVLRNLSWRADTNSKQVLREVGAVKGLTKAAMTCQKEATLKSVLSALWNLTAHCSMNKVALCSVDGALGFLVDMLSYNSPTKTLAIVENAGGIMRNVSSHIAVREDYRQILRERNCLSVLLQHLKSPSLTVVSNSCGTLWNLSARCQQDQQFLWDHGAVPMLRSLIHSKHKMIAMGSSAALKNLLNSKPGKSHIITLDTTARNMNLPALPTLGARKQKALEQELDQNLAETCDNIEPATSPSTSNREEKNLFTATERQIAMNLERHRMTSSSPLMGNLASQISLSHSAHLASYLSCSNTLLKGALVTRSNTGSAGNVNRSDSKDSVTSTHSDSVFERVMRTGKVPVPTPRSKDLMRMETSGEAFKAASKTLPKDNTYLRYNQPPIPPPRSSTDMRTNYTESGYDVDQDSCDQPIDYSRKYSETKNNEAETPPAQEKSKSSDTKKYKKENSNTFGDYQETDLDQPTDYSLRYAEHHSETGSDISEPPGPSVHEDTIKHFATEGTPYETPIIFSTATSMSDLRVIGKEGKPKSTPNAKENPEVMTHSDEKDTCSIEDPPRHDNDRAISTPQPTSAEPIPEKRSVFDTKFSSGMISPEKPVNYCDEGTPGYFSRVSSLSSLGEPTEEDSLAKRNALATMHVEPGPQEQSTSSSSGKDKEGSKAVTFARSPLVSGPGTPGSPGTPGRFVEDTPLMFSRSSSLGSLPECSQHDDQGSVVSEVSRLTSGCISPSEIPDSPGQSAPLSPPAAPPPAHHADMMPLHNESCVVRSVFEERVSRFQVEHTPAQFSARTSLSSLTIDDDPKQSLLMVKPTEGESPPHTTLQANVNRQEIQPLPVVSGIHNDSIKGTQTPGDTCKVYFTEDTPAILSKAGSNSNLSVLSIDSSPPAPAAPPALPPPTLPPPTLPPPATQHVPPEHEDKVSEHNHHDTSDSSNLSDAGDLLEECIQKGIAQVVKNKGPQSEAQSTNPFSSRDDVYRSLPPYLRSSTETIKMSHEFARNLRDSESRSGSESRSSSCRAPPLPPNPHHHHHHQHQHHTGRKHQSRLQAKTPPSRERPKLPVTGELARNDSLSSLSLDSFGSTDREIFEETVKAGLSSVNPRAKFTLESNKGKAHSVERPADPARHARHHKSLDRSDNIANHRPAVKDPEFERNLASGAYSIKPTSKVKKLEQDFAAFNLTRSPYSYHGETSGYSLALQSRYRGHTSRFYDDGPPSLPARMEDPRRQLERSNSLSSLSNESFGSTDKEVFERCVRMGMSKAQPKKRDEGKLRVRSDDRLEMRESHRRRRKENKTQGALEKMVGEEYSKDRAILEEVIARGAGESKTQARSETKTQSKNVPAPSADSATADELADTAPPTGCDWPPAPSSPPQHHAHHILEPDTTADTTADSSDNTYEPTEIEIDRSNECLAPKSANTTIESDLKDELNRSNESYADVLDGSWSDDGSHHEYATTLTRKNKHQWTDIKHASPTDTVIAPEEHSKRTDTWNDNTCPDDVTFPTISGSVHMVSSIRSEVVEANMALPDLLEKSEAANLFSRPDLTDKLDNQKLHISEDGAPGDDIMINVEPPFDLDVNEHKFDSIISSAIEKEAARLAAQLKNSPYAMEASVTSLTSLDLDNIKPPSNLGSLLSLNASAHWDEPSSQSPKKNKNRKKSLPVALMVKRALSNSFHQGSSEHLDNIPVSLLDNIKPPSEMEHIDMEGSMISVASIASEVADVKDKTPIVFDFKQPVQDFPLCSTFTGVFHDLDKVNPPSLFDEMATSTLEIEQTTAHEVYDECISNTLNVVTDIPSGSEECTPLPSDISSVESTPRRHRDPHHLTPKEKRKASSSRYQTYTITDTVSESDVALDIVEPDDFVTWTKSESDRSDEYVTATSEPKSRRRLSAKQRRIEDRARYQTQTVSIHNIPPRESAPASPPDPSIESLKRRLAAKKTIKQKRVEDAERFRTRTLSEDIPPSPTFVTKDANFENVETTTGYDSLSSNEPTHQQLPDERDLPSGDGDSGHNEDDFELNSTQMQTYTRSFRHYLPVVESPAAVDMCVLNNLKNIEMTASYRRAAPACSSGPEPDICSEDRAHSESDTDTPRLRPKPKIIKPERRDESVDSNESGEKEQDVPKAIRGRKKAMYISPYRRSVPPAKKQATPARAAAKPTPSKPATNVARIGAKSTIKPPTKVPNPSTSPKKLSNKSPSKTLQQRTVAVPPAATKPLPLTRQGTFTKEDSTVPPKDLPEPDRRNATASKTAAAAPHTSPSRLPQYSRGARPPLAKTSINTGKLAKTTVKKPPEPAMKNSPSNHSLQSNDSGKTIVLARGSRQGSTSSVNSLSSKSTRDVESKVANVWRKTDKKPTKADKKVAIEGDTPKLIRSSTFEGQPKLSQMTAPKQKTAIGMRVSQIPSFKAKPTPASTQPRPGQQPATSAKKPTTTRPYARRQLSGQLTS